MVVKHNPLRWKKIINCEYDVKNSSENIEARSWIIYRNFEENITKKFFVIYVFALVFLIHLIYRVYNGIYTTCGRNI
jgi:hypothetical protein